MNASTEGRVHGRIVACLAALLLVAACVPVPGVDRNTPDTPRVMPIGPGDYYGVSWLDDDVLAIASWLPDGSELRLVSLDGASLGVVPLSAREPCANRMQLALARLPSGELGFGDVCEVHAVEFRAYDQSTGATRELGMTSTTPSAIAWARDSESAVYSSGSGICQALYVHDRTNDAPLDLDVMVQGSMFNAGQGLTVDEGGCRAQGLADLPAYAPDGTLAFFASSRAIGIDGQARLDVPWALVLRGDEDKITEILDEVHSPRGLVWLPNGKGLVFAGTFNDSPGLWIVRDDGTELRRIGSTALEWFTIAPDGSAIAAIVENGGAERDVVRYELEGVQ